MPWHKLVLFFSFQGMLSLNSAGRTIWGWLWIWLCHLTKCNTYLYLAQLFSPLHLFIKLKIFLFPPKKQLSKVFLFGIYYTLRNFRAFCSLWFGWTYLEFNLLACLLEGPSIRYWHVPLWVCLIFPRTVFVTSQNYLFFGIPPFFGLVVFSRLIF